MDLYLQDVGSFASEPRGRMTRLSLPSGPPEAAPVGPPVGAQRGSASELVVCPVCFLPVSPGPPSSGGGCASHKGLLHAECLSSLPTRGCPFCRPEVRALGKAGVVALVCEQMARDSDDLDIQIQGQGLLVALARRGTQEVQVLEECHGLSIAIDNMGRGQDFLVHQGLDLITIVCRVKKAERTPVNSSGFKAACHAVAKEIRRAYRPGQEQHPRLRALVVSAAVSLANLSPMLALGLIDEKAVEPLTRCLAPDADPQIQFEAVFILSSLASQKVAVPRLIAARVHMLALNLLPPAPVGNGALSFAIRTMGSGGVEDETDNGPTNNIGAADTARGRSASISATSAADKKLTYVVSLLADLCEHGSPHEEMENEGALCERIVKCVLERSHASPDLLPECCRAIVAIAAGGEQCADSLVRHGVCESINILLAKLSLPQDVLCYVLEAVLHLCQRGEGETSAAQARFFTLQTPKKVAKVLAAVYGMRANADPALVVACLHAVRGLATHHEGNAHALGKETLLCVRSLSKANVQNADLAGECSATFSALVQATSKPSPSTLPQTPQDQQGEVGCPSPVVGGSSEQWIPKDEDDDFWERQSGAAQSLQMTGSAYGTFRNTLDELESKGKDGGIGGLGSSMRRTSTGPNSGSKDARPSPGNTTGGASIPNIRPASRSASPNEAGGKFFTTPRINVPGLGSTARGETSGKPITTPRANVPGAANTARKSTGKAHASSPTSGISFPPLGG